MGNVKISTNDIEYWLLGKEDKFREWYADLKLIQVSSNMTDNHPTWDSYKHTTARKSAVPEIAASLTLMGKIVHDTEGNEAWVI